ncbi:MAG: ThiF family adenylyltransferase [Deltaproteobacteria bacterium]|nr:ThiF family adenylyltransferase [Deltaproteobacteria bacterium]
MPRIIILEALEKEIRQRIKESEKPIPIYGRSYREEDLYQLWSLEKHSHLQLVAKVYRESEGIYLLLSGKKKVLWEKLEIIPYLNEFTSRAQGIVDTAQLSEKLVSLIGLGSIGSVLALYLAQSSVGRFRLIDMDTFSASNVSRHACDMRYLGRYKTKAVGELILNRNPKVCIETFEEDFLNLPFEIQMKRLDGSDLVIASTDSTTCQFMINEVCLELKIPSLYVGCYERAQASEVVFVIPGMTPCLNCLMEFRLENIEGIKRKKRRIPYSDEDPNGFQAEPGLAVDISYPTIVAAAYALALLMPDSRRGVLLDPQRNLILLHSGNQPQGKYAEIFKMPFDYLYGRAKRNKRCELCQSVHSQKGQQK